MRVRSHESKGEVNEGRGQFQKSCFSVLAAVLAGWVAEESAFTELRTSVGRLFVF
jgi:hypothetical protein